MVIELCSCDRYAEPHSHVQDYCSGVAYGGAPCPECGRVNIYNHYPLQTPQGPRASYHHKDPRTDRIVRCVDWRGEAERLAQALRDELDEPNTQAAHEALARWERATVEDGRVVVEADSGRAGEHR